ATCASGNGGSCFAARLTRASLPVPTSRPPHSLHTPRAELNSASAPTKTPRCLPGELLRRGNDGERRHLWAASKEPWSKVRSNSGDEAWRPTAKASSPKRRNQAKRGRMITSGKRFLGDRTQ